jgi:predicted MFS family arabinose efflux permease
VTGASAGGLAYRRIDLAAIWFAAAALALSAISAVLDTVGRKIN